MDHHPCDAFLFLLSITFVVLFIDPIAFTLGIFLEKLIFELSHMLEVLRIISSQDVRNNLLSNFSERLNFDVFKNVALPIINNLESR